MPAHRALNGERDPAALARPVRVMIVDDSAVARTVLARMIGADSRLEVAETATSAAEALRLLEISTVDVVLLDLDMPGASGVEALPAIVRCGRGARVLVLSACCEEGGGLAREALATGASDILAKPGATAFAGSFSKVLADRLVRLGAASREAPADPPAASAAPISLRPMPQGDIACLALGASTGGIQALLAFFAALPPRIGLPILITQHLPPFFLPYFAAQMEAGSGRPARLAADGMALQPDTILIAPGDAHLGLAFGEGGVQIRLDREIVARSTPSVDHMLRSAAEAFGAGALGVVFTGMGRDGLAGSAALVGRGGAVMVQDAESSAVWGMPRAVAEAGLASAVLPPAGLARCIADLRGVKAWS